MASKELSILLLAKDLASKTIGKVSKEIGTLGRTSAIARRGLGNLATNLSRLGVVAAAGLGVAVKSGIDTLAELENANASTAAALAATGLAARVSATDVRAWSEEIETAVGAAVDDKEIQRAGNTLIRFGNVSEKNLRKAMEVATDLGVSMGGTESAAKMLAKALADPVRGMTALRRAGVVLSKEDEKRIKQLVKLGKTEEARAFLLDQLAAKTEGAAKASAGPYQTALNKLADVTEDAKKALAEGFLPVIEKVADMLARGLADPATMSSVREFGRTLASGLDSLVEIAKNLPWQQIGDSLRLAGTGAKTVLSAFTQLPPWVQTAVLTGWGLNKLTGGALTGIVGELGKGLIRGVLGMNAGVVNLRAATVTGVGGGVGGAPVGGARGRIGSLASGVAKVFMVGMAATAAVELAAALGNQSTEIQQQGRDLVGSAQTNAPGMSNRDLINAINSIDQQLADPLNQAALSITNPLNHGLDNLLETKRTLQAELAKNRAQEMVDSVKNLLGINVLAREAGGIKARVQTADLANTAGLRGVSSAVSTGTTTTTGKLTALSAATSTGLGTVATATRTVNSTLAAKNFSPTINVPVSVYSKVSVRDTTVQTNISARYGSVKVL